MTSKEALKLLYSDAENYAYFNETEEDLSEIKAEYELIKQDLERLEKVKKELNQTKSNFKNSQTHSKSHYKRLIDKYLKLEKVIEILKDYLMIKVSINRNNEYCLDACDYAIPNLDKEQYDLLKEYL